MNNSENNVVSKEQFAPAGFCSTSQELCTSETKPIASPPVAHCKENWCEIFKTGIHTDSKGKQRAWTKDDLDTIVKNFEEKNPDVPICIGHPKTNSPAYGWVHSLKVEGNKLYCTYKDVLDEFKTAVKRGLFKTRSISLNPDLTLRHIAFLGATPPAIKGMEQFCFENTEDGIVINFEQEEQSCVPQSQSSTLNLLRRTTKTTNSDNNEREIMEEDLKQTQQELKETKENLETLEKENKDLKAQIEATKKEALNKEFEEFCENAIKEGKILPAQKQSVITILENCAANSSDFSESETNPVKVFKDFVSNLKQIDFSEVATKNNVSENNEIDFSDSSEILKAIQKTQKDYLERGIEINSAEALNILKKENK